MALSVLVTGASSGIGRATALYLDRLGWQVFATVRRQEDAHALAQVASHALTPLLLDVTDIASIGEAAKQVDRFAPDGLDGVVNNAGVAVGGPLEVLPLAELRYQFEINTIGQLAVTQAFLPLLRRRQGRLINVSSISGRIATPFVGAYAASKFALEAMSDALRSELGFWGMHVVVVEPGATESAIRRTATARAEQLIARLPPSAHQLYGRILARLSERARTPDHAVPPERVARVIHRALTARRPRTRYLVGRDAKIGALLRRILPDRVLDWILRH